MKKTVFLILLLIFWVISIVIVIWYDREVRKIQTDSLEEAIEIPVSFKRDIIFSHKDSPFAFVKANLVPNRFKNEMLYYLYVNAKLSIQSNSIKEDIQTKGYFLFKSTYNLLRFRLDVKGGYGSINLIGKIKGSNILISAEDTETQKHLFEINIPTILSEQLIRIIVHEGEKASSERIIEKAIYGDYSISVSEESLLPDLIPINSNELLKFQYLIDGINNTERLKKEM